MTRALGLRLAVLLLVAIGLSLPAEEAKENQAPKKKGGAASAQAAKPTDKAAVDKEGVAEAPVATPEDVEAFRKREDPAAVEIVTLHDEIDKAYTDLRTAINVAAGDDKQARKAKTEIKALEARIRRQTRKLEAAVEKVAMPIDRDYKSTKRKYDGLQEKAKAFEDQKQEKRATATYQQADRYTGQMEAAKRTLEAVRSFLTFESAEGIELSSDRDDTRPGKGFRSDKGGKDRDN
jgi:DNA repair exonuclease SbcCD ATPase subunit